MDDSQWTAASLQTRNRQSASPHDTMLNHGMSTRDAILSEC